MNFNEVKQIDTQFVMPTYGRSEICFEYGKNATLFDKDNKSYIDFSSGIGVNSIGHANQAWVQAVTEQAKKLAHTSNLYYNEPAAKAAQTLAAAATFNGKAPKLFFANSGAEANEGMIKLARKYSFDKYGAGRSTILTLVNSFHGRTITTLSATGQDSFHNYFFPFTDGFKYSEPIMEKVTENLTGDVCAVMLECIQGEGGVFELNKSFVNELVSYCKSKDILILSDEVQTGIGRTGKMFGFEHYAFVPDCFTLAKGLGGGLPIGAVVAYNELGDVLSAGMHGSTFGANPVSCAGVLAVLNIVVNLDFLNEVTKKGDFIKTELLNADLPIKEIRGKGLMLGIEFESIDAKELNKKLLVNKLVTLTAKTALRLLPPLTITENELKTGCHILISTIRNIL